MRRAEFDGLGQWACQEAAGREKLVKTPAPAQEVGVSRRRPLARAPCVRGSEFFGSYILTALITVHGVREHEQAERDENEKKS